MQLFQRIRYPYQNEILRFFAKFFGGHRIHHEWDQIIKTVTKDSFLQKKFMILNNFEFEFE